MKSQTSSPRVAFAGGNVFAEPIFAELVEKFDNLTLISKEDKQKGRSSKSDKSAIKILAESQDIPIFEPKNKLELEKTISNIKPDLVVVASLGIIISENTLKIPKYGFLNVHFSLLPLHRGPSPVQSTILNGDKKTGITIQKVVPEIDAGDIVYKYEIDLRGDETTKTLGKTLADIAAYELPSVIHDCLNEEIKPEKQDSSRATFTKIIQKSDGKIDWSEQAEVIERKVRAYTPWPSAYTFWDGKMLKILEAEVLDNNSSQKVGTFHKIDSGSGSGMTKEVKYGIQAGKGILVINKLQLEGKKPLLVSDFLLGNSKIVGEILG
ncbi:MAG: methionyl-tRNA formyltransferase [Patescibacteria group bacterium]